MNMEDRMILTNLKVKRKKRNMSMIRCTSFRTCFCIFSLSCALILLTLTLDVMVRQNAFSDKIIKSISNYVEEQTIAPADHTASPVYTAKKKMILYWTKLWSSDNMDFGDGDIFDSCPVWNCMATNNRTAVNVEDFDAIIFHALNVKTNDLPQRRSPHQIYVFLDLESEIFHPIPNDNVYKMFYNWTMTYRRDSTLMRPYGVVRRIDTMEYIPPHIPAVWKDVSDGIIGNETDQRIRGKKKLVSWFASNCRTCSKREVYVKALQQYIKIDIFGRCGTFECNRADDVSCFKMVEKNYYFYLAFENSLCVDYVTEKAFKFLQYDVVPVVYGHVDYSTILPPGSYIDVRDFSSPKELARYLQAVSEDPEWYASFFKWKSYFTIEIRPERFTICELCKKLHEIDDQSPMIINDIYSWWTAPQCLREPTFKGVPGV